MGAITNVVLTDAAGTPVDHTFKPARTQSDFANWEDRSTGIYIGYNKLTLQLTRPTGNSKTANRNLRLHLKIETPKMEVVSNDNFSGIAPAPTVSYRPVLEVVGTFPERCTLQDRKDILAFMKDALAESVIGAFFEDYEVPY